MSKKKYTYFTLIFFVIGTAIALNKAEAIKSSPLPPPVVDFTFNNNSCSGQSVSFNSNVTGDGPFDYTWNFGDGSTSTQANPNHVFNENGCGTQDFDVSITVIDDNGLSTTVVQTITILEEPNIEFIQLNPGVAGQFNNCGNTSGNTDFFVEVGNISSSAGCVNSYNVDWGDGTTQTNVSFPTDHTYTEFGTFDLEITAIGDNGCESTVSYSVKNSSSPAGGISGPADVVNLCTPTDPLTFFLTGWQGNTTDTTYEIDWGDGTPAWTATQQELIDDSSPASVAIDHIYTETSCPTEYVVQLWIRNACAPDPDPATWPNILIVSAPESDFEVPDALVLTDGTLVICTQVSTLFENTSEQGFGFNCNTDQLYEWDFGDGTAPVITNGPQSVNHTYANPDTYVVTLSTINAFCGDSVISKEICVEPPLSPTFTSNAIEGCAPFNIALNNTTDETNQCGTPEYEWTVMYAADFCGTSSDFNFINGTDANSINPEIEFVNPGIYQLKLEATNPCGTIPSTPLEIIVKSPPILSLDPIDDFCGSNAIIAPSATVENCGPNAPTYNWSLNVGTSPTDWDFVNGTNENSEFPEIEFYTPNEYILSLEISNACGIVVQDQAFDFALKPEVSVLPTDQTVCTGVSAETLIAEVINGFDINGDGVINALDFDFQWFLNGSSITGATSNTYDHVSSLPAGVYEYYVEISQSNGFGCDGISNTVTITVNDGPSILTQPEGNDYCQGAVAEILSFELGGNPTGTIEYQWYFNQDGNTDPTDPNTTAVAAPEGIQEDFQPPTDSQGTFYYFCVISFSGSGSCNEINTVAVPVNINPNVAISDISPLDQLLCAGANAEELSVTLSSIGAGQFTYNWFSSTDNVIDASDTPVGGNSNTYNPGTLNTADTYYYYVTIDVDESLGCSDISSDIFTIEVIEDPEVTITPIEQTICTNVDADLLVATVSGGLDSNNDGNVDNQDYNFQWYLNGNSITEVPNTDGDDSTFSHDSSLPAGVYEYYVEISQSNGFGCDGISNTVTITVNDGPSILTQPEGNDYCQGAVAEILSFELGGNPTGTIEYQWYFNQDGNTDPTDPNTTAVAAPEGIQEDFQPPTDSQGTFYYFCVISFSGSGSCNEINTVAVPVNINPNVAISDISPLDQLLCAGANAEELSVTLSSIGAGQFTYNWFSSTDNVIDASDTPVGGNSNTYNPGTLNTADTYYYYVTIDVDESLGCSDISSDIFTIEVIEDPEVTITPIEQTICTNVDADLLVATVSGGLDSNNDGNVDNQDYNFQWYLNGNSITEVPNTDGDDSTFSHDSSLPAGVYEYYVEISQSNGFGCDGISNTVTITVNDGPSILTQPEGNDYCQGAVAEILSFELGGNPTGTIEYQWYFNQDGNTDPTDPNTTAVAAPEGIQEDFQPPTDSQGTFYYFCVISFSGSGSCNEINTVAVPVNINPNVAISDISPLDQLLCAGANAEELSVTLSSIGAGQFTYNWFSSTDNVIDASDTPVGGNSNTYNPGTLNTADTYYYYVTIDVDESLGCSDISSDIFTIEVIEDPEVTITPIEQTICTNVDADLLVATVSGGLDSNNDGNVDNQDYNFQWYLNGNSITEVPNTDGDDSTFSHDSSLPAGVYEYYVEISQSNGFGCDGISNTVTITVNDGPSILTQPEGNDYCLGDNIADLELNIQNGVGTPTIQWYVNDTNDTDTPTEIGINSNTLEITNTNVGTSYYYATITFTEGGCGVLTTDIVAITINQVPVISDYDTLICSNNPFLIIPDEVNGNIVPSSTTYTWATPLVNPVGAIEGALEELNQVTEISQVLENTTTNPATVVYTVTPRSGDCIGETFDIVVTVNPSINLTSDIQSSSCFGANDGSINVDISGGIPFTTGEPYTIIWTGPNGFISSDEDISGLEPGDYFLTILDSGGCPITDIQFFVDEPNELFVTSVFDPETISCFGANDGEISLDVQGGTPDYTYNWTKDGVFFSNDEDLQNLEPGFYEVTVSDSNQCPPVILTFTIEEPPLLEIANIDKTNVICFNGTTGAIDLDVTGGRPDYTFSWIGPNGFTSSDENIENLIAGTYTVTVEDSSECNITQDIEITQNPAVEIEFTQTEIECYNDNDAVIDIFNVFGGVGPYTIEWSDEGNGFLRTDLGPGLYIAIITDSLGCPFPFEFEIASPPIFEINPVVTQMSCAGENDASIELNLVGGVEPITVVWDDDPSAGLVRNNLSPGTYNVTITDGDDPSCVIRPDDGWTILDIAPLALTVDITDALDCENVNSGAINISVTGGTIAEGSNYNFEWSNGATTEDLVDIGLGFYNVLVTDDNGCTISSEPIEVTRFEPLTVEVESQTEANCDTKTIDQIFVAIGSGGVPGYEYTWSNGNVSGLNGEIMTTDDNGLVILEITDSFGCTNSISFDVETPVIGNPDFEISSFGILNYGVFAIQDPIQFTNLATGDYVSVLWDFGDGSFSGEENPIHTYLQIGNYVVTQTVTYPFGCVYEYTYTLIIEDGYKLIMPNAFTPNKDGLNDFFGPEQIGLNSLELSIYDTWGSLIYSESGDNIRGWDGKINDEDAENGNYHYTFKASTFYGNVVEKQGAFVFIK